MKHTRKQLEAMDEATLERTYGEIVGGGDWEDGKFIHLVVDVSRAEAIADILQGECKWQDFGKRSVGSKALKGDGK